MKIFLGIIIVLFLVCSVFGFFIIDFLHESIWLELSFSFTAISMLIFMLSTLKEVEKLVVNGKVIKFFFRIFMVLSILSVLYYIGDTKNYRFIALPAVQIIASVILFLFLEIVTRIMFLIFSVVRKKV